MDHVLTQWDTFMKSATDASKALEALNLKLVEQLSKKQVELMTAAFEASNKWVSSFSEHKALPELMTAQSKLASDYNAKLVAAARETANLLTVSREELKSWFEKSFQTISAQTGIEVPKATARKAA